MSDFTAFIPLGFRHIVALDAADHVLFLLALAAIYRGRDWRPVLWVVSAFTVGHSLSLALAVTGVVTAPARLIEFLIPVTIVLTGIENLVLRERATAGGHARHRPLLAGAFGLVHGAGFAGYLQGLFMDRIALPLLGFNVGIEFGQLVVLAAAAVAFAALDRVIQLLRLAPVSTGAGVAFRFRLVAVSTVVTLVAGGWAWERWPA